METLFFEPNSLMTQLVFATLIFILALIVGKIAGKVLEKVLINTGFDQIVKKTTKKEINIGKIIGGIASYVIYFLGFIMALNQIGITTTVLNILSGAILVLVLLVVFLSIKDVVPNIIAGMMIHTKGLIDEGDIIKIHDIEGEIIQTSIVEARVKTKNGDIIFIPNSRFIKYEVTKRAKKIANLKKEKNIDPKITPEEGTNKP